MVCYGQGTQYTLKGDGPLKTLFFGGPILTLEHPRYTEALLVEDGRIAAVGTRILCSPSPTAPGNSI